MPKKESPMKLWKYKCDQCEKLFSYDQVEPYAEGKKPDQSDAVFAGHICKKCKSDLLGS